MTYWFQYSAVSRAILKPVYQFGIPNSNPQMLKSVDLWCKLLPTFLVAEPRVWWSELFRMQNSQKFSVFCPWTPLGRAYSIAPDSAAAQRFFFLLRLSKNWHSQKIARYGTAVRIKSIVIPHFKSVSMLHANTQSPDLFWRKRWPKWWDFLKLCHKSLTLLKLA